MRNKQHRFILKYLSLYNLRALHKDLKNMIFLWQILDIFKGIGTKFKKNIGIRRAISSGIMLLQTLINVTSFLNKLFKLNWNNELNKQNLVSEMTKI